MQKLLKRMVFFYICAVLSFGFIQNTEAADYYLGTYSDGRVAYLEESSMLIGDSYRQGCHDGMEFVCSVKAVATNTNANDVVKYKVHYWNVGTYCMIKNGELVDRTIHSPNPNYLKNNPVENSLSNYCYNIYKKLLNQSPERIW